MSKIYGGNNTNPNPFKPGNRIRQTYHINKDGKLVTPGREEYEFVKMDEAQMVIRPLNEDGLYSVDTVDQDMMGMLRKSGFKPSMKSTFKLHYKFADRFSVIN